MPLGFGEWVLIHAPADTGGEQPARTLREAAAAFLRSAPQGSCDLEFLPVPGGAFGPLLGSVMARRARTGTVTCYYAAEEMDESLARTLACVARIRCGAWWIERVDPGEMPGTPQQHLVVVLEGTELTAYLSADLITARLAAALEDLLCAISPCPQ